LVVWGTAGIDGDSCIGALARYVASLLAHLSTIRRGELCSERLDEGIALTAHEMKSPVVGAMAAIAFVMGSDQIDACARYAGSKGVPYLSGGVHEQRPRVGSLATATYFGVSMTYEQQVPLLVNLIRGDHSGKKVAVLTADNDSLTNYHQRAESAMKSAFGDNVVLTRRVPKNTGARDAPGIGREICQSGADVVVWNAAPSGLINVSKAMVCEVNWMGPGNTNGLNIVATAGCPQIDGAQYFATVPGIDDADKAYKRLADDSDRPLSNRGQQEGPDGHRRVDPPHGQAQSRRTLAEVGGRDAVYAVCSVAAAFRQPTVFPQEQ
jgi:hypothetical protein